jgi:hypothetical protein
LILVWLIVLVYALCLRLHFIKKHELTENSQAVEVFLGLCCCPCSLAQMARHSFGYRLVFEGDSRPSPPRYDRLPQDAEGSDCEQRAARALTLELTEHETEVLGHASHTV